MYSAPHLKPQTVWGVLPIPSAAKTASRSPKGRMGGPEGPGLSLPGFARHLGGLHPTSAASLTMARHRYPELGDRGYSGGGSSCSSSSSAARPRLHTLCPQRAPPPPPPAPTVPQRPPRAPRLARPRPSRLARSRCTAASYGSLRVRNARFSPSTEPGGSAAGHARSSLPGLLSVSAFSASCIGSAFLSGGRARVDGG